MKAKASGAPPKFVVTSASAVSACWTAAFRVVTSA